MTATMSHTELYANADAFLSAASDPTPLEVQRDLFRSGTLESGVTLDARPASILARSEEAARHFRLLKQRYIDLEAKRQFLFTITGDAPAPMAPGENERLAEENREKKRVLKEKKGEVERIRAETLEMAKENGEKHAELSRTVARVGALQREISAMELELARLNAQHPPDTRMTTGQAATLLDEQTERLEDLTSSITGADSRISTLAADLAARRKRVDALAKERHREEARASEVATLRSMGENHALRLADWFGRMSSTYRTLLGVKDLRVEEEGRRTVVEYDEGVVLTLEREGGGRGKLTGASVEGTDADMAEAINAAVAADDAPGLVADVLVRIRPL